MVLDDHFGYGYDGNSVEGPMIDILYSMALSAHAITCEIFNISLEYGPNLGRCNRQA